MDEKLTTKQAAHFLGCCPQTLEKWRMTDRNLKYEKGLRDVYYWKSELQRFKDSRKRELEKSMACGF